MINWLGGKPPAWMSTEITLAACLSSTFFSLLYFIFISRDAGLLDNHWQNAIWKGAETKLNNSSPSSSLCRESFCLRICKRPEFSPLGAEDSRALLSLSDLAFASSLMRYQPGLAHTAGRGGEGAGEWHLLLDREIPLLALWNYGGMLNKGRG